jgi:hypothetical protein
VIQVANLSGYNTVVSSNAQYMALFDGSTQLTESYWQGAANTYVPMPAMQYMVTGDGASHTIHLEYKVLNGTSVQHIMNTAVGGTPTIIYTLTPSN